MEMCWRPSGAGRWRIIVQSDFLAGIQCECRPSGNRCRSSSTVSAELTCSSQEECIHFAEGSEGRLLPRPKVSFSETNRISKAPDEMGGKKMSSRFLCCWEHHNIVPVRVTFAHNSSLQRLMLLKCCRPACVNSLFPLVAWTRREWTEGNIDVKDKTSSPPWGVLPILSFCGINHFKAYRSVRL